MADKDVIRFGKNVSPNRVTVEPRNDGSGKTDVYYNDKGSNQKGHTVQNDDGSIEFARTMQGTKLINKNPK